MSQRLLGYAFLALGTGAIIFVDVVLGVVWLLLGGGLALLQPTITREGRRRVEWHMRNLLAAGLLVLGIAATGLLLIIDVFA
jgi:hypothetical protein